MLQRTLKGKKLDGTYVFLDMSKTVKVIPIQGHGMVNSRFFDKT